MSHPWFVSYIGDWDLLAQRLTASGALERWARQEPALAGLSDFTALKMLSNDPARSDLLLGALVRLGSAGGGDDEAAVLVVAHLLVPGCLSLLRRFGPQRGRAAELIFGELALHIRASRRGRDCRAHAANLLWRTDHGIRRQLNDRRISGQWLQDPVVGAPADWERAQESWLSDAVSRGSDPGSEELHLIDVLLWAERTGVVSADDVALLMDLSGQEGDAPGADTNRVAAARGVSVRTVERRRRKAVEALTGASSAFLAAA